MSRLIVNADDFGLTAGVNRAIRELNQRRILTSATLMARASATVEAVEIANTTPTLGVGCHVVLVDGEPVLPPSEITTLADPLTGRFYPKLGVFLRRLLSGAITASDIENEASAQITSLQGRGVSLSHIDTHKHTHMFPAVLRPVLRAARAAGIHAVRNPFEPVWSIRATPYAPWVRRMEVSVLRRLYRTFRQIVAEEEFFTTDGAMGVLATGTLDANSVGSLLAAMPSGTWELVTHPGYSDADLARANTRLLAARDLERAALEVLRNANAELISFAHLRS